MIELRSVFACLNVADPLVAWLIYRGEMVSASEVGKGALSFWTVSYLRDLGNEIRANRFETELALERLRQDRYPEVVSRVSGFYVFPDTDAASAAEKSWGDNFRAELLAEVGLRTGARISRHDAKWISHEFDSPSQDWMSRYLDGEPYGDAPIWELVVDGRALVFGTELRKAAYEIVKSEWPKSLALLELARVGVELDSDLGLITGKIIGGGDQRALRYVMNFEDATSPAFLERFAAFEGPKNTHDLRPDSDLAPPDLGGWEFPI